MQFPKFYSYPAVTRFPHHVMSLENGRLFFTGCFREEQKAIDVLGQWRNLEPEGLKALVQGMARYHNGSLVEVMEPLNVAKQGRHAVA